MGSRKRRTTYPEDCWTSATMVGTTEADMAPREPLVVKEHFDFAPWFSFVLDLAPWAVIALLIILKFK